MSKQQTAVDFLFDKIKSHFENDGDLFESLCFTYAITKKKEKQQIIDAWENAFNHGACTNEDEDKYHGTQYYSETYKQSENESN